MHSRRRFLCWLCSALAAGASGIAARGRRDAAWSRSPEGAFDRLWRGGSARRIGAEYVDAHRDLDAAALRRSLGVLGPPERWNARGLSERARRDFEEDRIVRVGGWMLAESEAQLCALAFLESA